MGSDASFQVQPPTRSTVRICIIGYYGSNSTGDHAILKTFIQEILHNSNLSLTIICQGASRAYEKFARSNIVVHEHFRVFGRGGLKNVLKGRVHKQARTIADCDLLVIGGGSLLHDRFGLRTLLMTLDEILWAKLCRRPVAIFAMGVGPLIRQSARWLVAKAVSMCDVITVRDNGSKQLLVEIGVPADKVRVVSDPAFLLAPMPIAPQQAPWLRGGVEKTHKLVGVFLVDSLEFLFPNERAALIKNLARALDELHHRFDFEFVLLPFSVMMDDDDRIMAYNVVAEMKHAHSAHVVERTFEPEEMLWIEGQFLMNIAIRFHAMIFSLSSAVPVVAIEYDPKVGHAMRDFGLDEYLISIDPKLSSNLVVAVSQAYANRNAFIDCVKEQLPSRRHSARETFGMLRALLTVSPSGGSARPLNDAN